MSVTRSKQSVPLNHNQGFTLRCTVTAPDTFDKWSNPLYTSSIHNDSNIQYTKSGDEHDLQIVSMKLVIAGKWTCSSKQGNSDYITIEVTRKLSFVFELVLFYYRSFFILNQPLFITQPEVRSGRYLPGATRGQL